MSGHSKWSTIKRKKAVTDAKRGRIFTKIIKEITIASRNGGGDLDSNPRLRTAVNTAKIANMPADNIDRAIKKGTGELPGVSYEEINYEGYGPEGVAVIVECVTDNKNRTTAELKHIFSKSGGSIGSPGCVSWMFEKKGLIDIIAQKKMEEKVFDHAIESGADDINFIDDGFEIITSYEDFFHVKESIEKKYKISSAEITMFATNMKKIDNKDKIAKVLKFLDLLDEQEDAQKIHANIDISEDMLEQIQI